MVSEFDSTIRARGGPIPRLTLADARAGSQSARPRSCLRLAPLTASHLSLIHPSLNSTITRPRWGR